MLGDVDAIANALEYIYRLINQPLHWSLNIDDPDMRVAASLMQRAQSEITEAMDHVELCYRRRKDDLREEM